MHRRSISNPQSAISNSPATLMDGVLIVDKPAGPTSHDVVARVRRALRTPRIGHTGTLDPLATGVLPLVIGRATRLASLLSGADKEYVAGNTARCRNGHLRCGGPRYGPHRNRRKASTRHGSKPRWICSAGRSNRRPHRFRQRRSAGFARTSSRGGGWPCTPRQSASRFMTLTMVQYPEGLARIRVRVSAGFYVRSLAHDLGQRLGCGAYLETLRRVKAGDFAEGSAIPLDDLDRDGHRGSPPDHPRGTTPARTFQPSSSTSGASSARAMATRSCPKMRQSGARQVLPTYKLLDASGRLIAIAESRPGGLLHPVTVLV